MRTVGIIAEYNPFHNGHLHQYELLRREDPNVRIVIVLSGDFVQRGEPALLDKYTRTRMALLSGADLVLELPAAFSTQSAELFARGGAGILNACGLIDTLCFGSEEGPSPLFEQLTALFEQEPQGYRDVLKQALKSGLSFPAAREKAASAFFADSLPAEKLHAFLASPNNILGIEYQRALRRLNSSITLLPLKRTGMAYHEEILRESVLPSASAIRRSVFEGTLPRTALPSFIYSILEESASKNAFMSASDLDDFLRYKLLMLDPSDMPKVHDLSPALADRILHNRYAFTSFAAFADGLKTRELTRSRICRALLHLILDMADDPGTPSFIRVLGFRRSSSGLISEMRQKASLPVITRPAREVSALGEEAKRAFEDNTRASCLYESLKCKRTGESFIHEYQKNMVIV